MKVPTDVKRPTAIQLQNHVRIKLDSMKRAGESYTALIERLLEEVVLYREETKFLLMNKEMHE